MRPSGLALRRDDPLVKWIMGRCFFRFFSESLLAFETRLEHQSNQRRTVKLHFEPLEIDCCIYDHVLPQPNGPVLYRGLGIDMYALVEDGSPAKAQPFCERLLALLSYSHMSPCHPARLEMTYDADPGKQDRAFTFVKTHSALESASLRKIDVDLFRSVTEKQHFNDEPKWLALEWFRKGLTEKHTLDEFIAYWSALELLAGALKLLYPSAIEKSYHYCPVCQKRIADCPHCGADAGTTSPWSAIFHLIGQGIGLDKKDFKAVRKFRGAMLHGGAELSNQAVEQMKVRELAVLRRLAIFALAAAFQLPRNVAEQIANQSVHRVVSPRTTKLFGTLNLDVGEPPAIESVDLQPWFRVTIKPETYNLSEEGKLSASVDLNYQAVGANYKTDKTEVWTDRSAGISGVSISVKPGATSKG